MDSILYFLIGVLIGFLISKYLIFQYANKKHLDGFLIVDDTNEDKTTYILDIHVDPNDITKKKYVRFKVNVFEKNE